VAGAHGEFRGAPWIDPARSLHPVGPHLRGGAMRFGTVWEMLQTFIIVVSFVIAGLLIAKCMGRI
jgi:hypothetical protein